MAFPKWTQVVVLSFPEIIAVHISYGLSGSSIYRTMSISVFAKNIGYKLPRYVHFTMVFPSWSAQVYGGSEEIMADLSVRTAIKAYPKNARL